ncbi:hypothetical protein [Jiella sonneratiae]|uniref:Uncharacterized protein n=1 Tax=Jiella sonneratiae TaxID=2816856 RepID=A0ABS3J9D5_9HYPH|nr:hypothetical protein [Jiella sonneratiae]MBO0906289.1 hypothetical protein [Jiella sonneratiae]
MPIKSLSPSDQRRIDRLRNRKGRRKPAKVPARLARTSAFAPKRRGLITDSGFQRLYVVPGHSVVRVHGRELGSQHRDALYAIFRLPFQRVVENDPDSPIGRTTRFQVTTTWRELIGALNLTEHANNVASLALTVEEIMQVVITIYEGNVESIVKTISEGRQPDTPHSGKHIIHSFEAEGAKLDSSVYITYGQWATESMARLRLVSLNADVQFELKSDYAKSFWPYIDSLPNHNWVDEAMLSALVGRDLWAEDETAASRRDFRAYCRKAFDDMVHAGGLLSWEEEVRGHGRKKTRRYHYKQKQFVQMELELGDAGTPA